MTINEFEIPTTYDESKLGLAETRNQFWQDRKQDRIFENSRKGLRTGSCKKSCQAGSCPAAIETRTIRDDADATRKRQKIQKIDENHRNRTNTSFIEQASNPNSEYQSGYIFYFIYLFCIFKLQSLPNKLQTITKKFAI
jgi:hypothetical protein